MSDEQKISIHRGGAEGAENDGDHIMDWLRWSVIKTIICSHKFRLEDLSLTGIPVPPTPDDNEGNAAIIQYWIDLPKHPSHAQRVRWPCCKCGKIFFAHCGLDVLSKYSRIINKSSPVETILT